LQLDKSEETPLTPLRKRLVAPWKESFELIRENRSFAQFQMGFMLGGFGLMIMAPAYPIYFADVLNLGYDQVTMARCLWMAVGVTLSTALWRLAIERLRPVMLTPLIRLGLSLFPFSLLITMFEIMWFSLGFLFYEIAQAGSHLLWKLSGTLFSGNRSSSAYTAVNVLTVGLRGLIGPFLGGLICKIAGPGSAIFVGMGFCFYSAYLMATKEKFAFIRT